MTNCYVSITESQKETLHNVLRRLYIIVAVALLQTRTNKNRLVTDLWWTCGVSNLKQSLTALLYNNPNVFRGPNVFRDPNVFRGSNVFRGPNAFVVRMSFVQMSFVAQISFVI